MKRNGLFLLFVIFAAKPLWAAYTVTSPNPGDTFTAGQAVTIQWNDNGTPSYSMVSLSLEVLTTDSPEPQDVVDVQHPAMPNHTGNNTAIPYILPANIHGTNFLFRVLGGIGNPEPTSGYSGTFTILPVGGGPANHAPTAAFSAVTHSGGVVQFDGSASSDPLEYTAEAPFLNGKTTVGYVAIVTWDFGDGSNNLTGDLWQNPITLMKPAHAYPAAGTYNVTLTVEDDQGLTNSMTQSVTATSPAPVLSVSPAALSFTATAGGSNPAAQPVTLSNSGADASNWTASSDAAWLSTSQFGGSLAAGGSLPLNVIATLGSLAANTYTGHLTFTDQSGTEQSVTVTFIVNSSPAPTANAQAVTTAFNTAKAITLSGTDPNNLTLTYALTSNPAHGTFSGAAPNLIYTPTNNYSGPDNFSFTVTNSGGLASEPAAITITVNPATVPNLSVTPNTLSFAATAGGANPATQQIMLSNIGTAASNWAASSNASWLSVSQLSGSLAVAGSLPLNVTVTIGTLAANFYTGELAFTDQSGTSQTISVTFNVNAPAAPALGSLDPTLVTAGDSFTLLINGSGFDNNPIVTFNGTAKIPLSISSSQLSVAVLPADVVNIGNINVTVAVPYSVPSNPLSLRVVAAPQTPDLHLPPYMPLNSTIQVSPQQDITFSWTVIPQTTLSVSNTPGAAAIVSDSPFKTSSVSPALALNSFPLSPGPVFIEVTATNLAGKVSAPAQALTTLTSNDNDADVFPNPWRADRDGGHPITFQPVFPGRTLRIFTLSGRLVKTIAITDIAVQWDLTADDGRNAASGIYLYLISGGQGSNAKGKFAVIR